MAFKTLFALSSFVALAIAHFHFEYPDPRGPYISDNQLSFCDGYTDAASNRSGFPLSNGVLKIDNHHSSWSAAVLIAVDQNPSNFSAFNVSSSGVTLPLAVDWFSSTGAGSICIPVDVASLNIQGVGDGSNVTLQAMFTGGDGNLFQCVDVTLRSDFSTPSNVSCPRTVNGTVDTTTSSTASSPSSSETSGAQQLSSGTAGILGLVAALLLI